MSEPLQFVVIGLAGVFRRLPDRTFDLRDLDRSLLILPKSRDSIFVAADAPIPIEASAPMTGQPDLQKVYQRFLEHLLRAEGENRVLYLKKVRTSLAAIDAFFATRDMPGLLALYREAAEAKRRHDAQYREKYRRFDPTRSGTGAIPDALNILWPGRFTAIT